MCGIAGFCDPFKNYTEEKEKWYAILQRMNQRQKHRGPDDDGIYLSAHCGLTHVRLAIQDPESGAQPMTRSIYGHRATICFNGEIYNKPTLRAKLLSEGISFETNCDTEVLLYGYLLHGVDFVKECNGIFAFCIWDETLQKLYLVRDRLGVKPLFYTFISDTLVFSSELKTLFSYPGIKPIADKSSLQEIFGLGPAKSYGKGVFQGILEVLPGHWIEFPGYTAKFPEHRIEFQGNSAKLPGQAASNATNTCYWRLESHPHEDSYEQTLEKTRFLVTDAIRMQMLSDVPICTFLSGGLDSSLVSSICNQALAHDTAPSFNKLPTHGNASTFNNPLSCGNTPNEHSKQNRLSTYSFDFVGNDKYFTSNAFQPSEDRPFVEHMVRYLGSDHTFLKCDNSHLINYLYKAVDARDLPCMADVEGSMLYFCEQVAKRHKVALTGECADEIFGGYPWFHKKECFETNLFPWSMDFTPRNAFLKNEILEELNLESYARHACQISINEVPCLPEDTAEEKRRREISYLNLRWFMQTLLDRMDRTSMYAGLEARVPFADHRIVEYLWNVPWHMKCRNGVEKSLLREAVGDLLPDQILHRKKSPYPKTYDPAYEMQIRKNLLEVLHDPAAPILELIDVEKTLRFCNTPSDYGKPFYGQLMAGPQLLAYLLQVNYWLKKYKVSIRL